MPSFLAQQLQKIATVSRQGQVVAGPKTTKQKPSFLFDAKKAADLDIDTIFSLGISGLAELKALDSRFENFEETLFSERLKGFDRALQTKEDNDRVDKSIQSFLRLLSPYFLEKGAGKALEWLVRRFRIHEFNVNNVMECILPYHETKGFVTMVSLIRFGDENRWTFLKPITKSRVPLDRATLVQRCITDQSILIFLCDCVARAVEAGIDHKSLWSLFATTTMTYLSTVAKITDGHMRTVLPYVFQFAKATEFPDLQAASYVVMSLIAQKTSLAKDALETMVTILMTSTSSLEGMMKQALLCVVSILQSQAQLAAFPDKSFRTMVDARETLLSICASYDVEAFLKPLLFNLVQSAGQSDEQEFATNCLEMLNHLIRQQLVPEGMIQYTVELVLNVISEMDAETRGSSSLADPLRMLQTRYPAIVNECIDSKLKTTDTEFYELVASLLSGTLSVPVEDTNTTLYLSLQHADKSMRLIALRKLSTLANEMESEFVRDILLERLQDREEDIVDFVLNMESLVSLVDDNDKLLHTVALVLNDVAFNSSVKISAVKVIASLLKTMTNTDAEIAIMQYLLVSKPVLDVSKKVMESVELIQSGMAKGLKPVLKKLMDENDQTELAVINEQIIAILAKNALKTKDLVGFYMNAFSTSTSRRAQILSALVLAKIVSESRDMDLAKQFLDNMLVGLKPMDLSTGPITGISTLSNSLVFKQLNAKKSFDAVYLAAVMSSMGAVIDALPATESINWLNVSEENKAYETIIVSIFTFITSGTMVTAYELLLQSLITKHLSRSGVIQFLARFWTANPSTISPLMQSRALAIATTYFRTIKNNANDSFKSDFQLVVPSILAVLPHASKLVREMAFDCLTAVKDCFDACISHLGNNEKTGDIWLYDRFYGEEAKVIQYLETAVCGQFLEMVLSWKEDVFTDHLCLDHYFVTKIGRTDADTKDMIKFKDAVLTSLLTHILATPSAHAQTQLLGMLRKIDSSNKLKTLVPLLEFRLNTLTTATTMSDDELTFVNMLIQCFTPDSVKALFESRSGRYVKCFVSMLQHDQPELFLSIQSAALKQITSQWFAVLNDARAKQVFDALLSLATFGSQNITKDVKMTLKSLALSANLIRQELAALEETIRSAPGSASANVADNARAKRVKGDAEDEAATVDTVTNEFYRLTTLLELLEIKSDIVDGHELIASLFDVADMILNVELSGKVYVGLEYMKQLVLASLLSLVKSVKESGIAIPEVALRVDVIVQIIRTTDNPQTHNQSLLLMAGIARIFPQLVLNNIMPVFTFMGANALRQDDNYSFHVIQQTLETIIPALVQERKLFFTTRKDLVMAVVPVIKVFVDALFHIPAHRRLRLFTVLVTTLGEMDFLDAIVALLLEKRTERGEKDAESLSEFCLAISQQFSPKIQLGTLIHLIRDIAAMPFDKKETEENEMETTSSFIFDLEAHNSKQLRVFQVSCLDYAGRLLSSKAFLTKLVELSEQNIDIEQAFEKDNLQLMEVFLGMIGRLSRAQMGERSDSGKARFLKASLKLCYEVLNKVNALLTLPMFLKVISTLLKHENVMIRRKSMVLLNEKVSELTVNQLRQNKSLFTPVVHDLKDILSADASTDDSIINKQNALLCLTTMASLMAKMDVEMYTSCLDVIVSQGALLHSNKTLVASAIVCITTFVHELGPRSVPYLPKFMPVILNELETTIAGESDDEVMQLGCLSSLDVMINTIPQFVAPYISKIFTNLLHPEMQTRRARTDTEKQIQSKVVDVLAGLSDKMAPRLVLPPVVNYLSTALTHGTVSLVALFQFIAQFIGNMSREDVVAQHIQLFKLFLVSLDFRRTEAVKLGDEFDIVENSVIDAFMMLVMKLNESLFKPLFMKTLDWATSDLLLKNGFSAEEVDQRLLVLYRLLDALLGRFKSIVSPFYLYALDHLVKKLKSYKETNRAQDALWESMISSVHKFFKYATEDMMTQERLDKLLTPLVDQMDMVGDDSAAYLKRMNTYLVPCLGQLAMSLGNDSMWKPLNHHVMMKSRSEVMEVRFVSLKVLDEFYNLLGEEFLSLLPETIPFLAELMEDDEPEVEKLCQQVCAKIQDYLGEDLTKYFNS